jgi:hypothetical protein
MNRQDNACDHARMPGDRRRVRLHYLWAENLEPVCGDCHRLIHRRGGELNLGETADG